MRTQRRARWAQHGHERGFTLVEIMVAMLAGLIVASAAFGLAKQGSRFFQQEYRIANAQFEAMVGFDRLRNDITRAGFLGESNVQHNPSRCPNGPVSAGWPAMMRSLAAVRLDAATPVDGQDALNGLAPDRITLAGSYASPELFLVRAITPPVPVATADISLAVTDPAVQRAAQGNLASLANVFRANRVVRIFDQKVGVVEYGLIQSFNSTATEAHIILNTTLVPIQGARGATCGYTGGGGGSYVSVINFIRYDVRNVAAAGPYAALFAANATGPGDTTRHELVRVEVDALGNEDATTLEVVSEYAVDLRFAFSVVTGFGATGVDPVMQSYTYGDANNYVWGVDAATSPVLPGSERIRSVRARLTVRSREADRGAGIPNGSTIFRYQIPGTNPATNPYSFARARTLSAEIQLVNLLGVTW